MKAYIPVAGSVWVLFVCVCALQLVGLEAGPKDAGKTAVDVGIGIVQGQAIVNLVVYVICN